MGKTTAATIKNMRMVLHFNKLRAIRRYCPLKQHVDVQCGYTKTISTRAFRAGAASNKCLK